MESYELNMMKGMVSVLNIMKEKPILTEEQYKERLADLKQFEDDTNFMFANSPNCPIDVQSVVEVVTDTADCKECTNIEDIIEFGKQKDLLICADICGFDVSITYTDGILTKINVYNILENVSLNIKKISNIPYKIDKSGTYIVEGKTAIELDEMKLVVHNVVSDDGASRKEDLDKAKDLGFDVIPNWLATNFNPKNLQASIDYVFEYMSDEELDCMGVVFKFNNINDNGCIIYRRDTSDEE